MVCRQAGCGNCLRQDGQDEQDGQDDLRGGTIARASGLTKERDGLQRLF